ncbi:hypothetical protein WJX84_001966 [Apatococcus fuscideae]|uniref:Uncharacterized protein n=1 Tax=Apatococcus fuscideae TaxID=2026836 RepID=A0AAW1TCD2_9CHLO
MVNALCWFEGIRDTSVLLHIDAAARLEPHGPPLRDSYFSWLLVAFGSPRTDLCESQEFSTARRLSSRSHTQLASPEKKYIGLTMEATV